MNQWSLAKLRQYLIEQNIVDEFGPLNLQPRHGGCWARGGRVDRLRATYHRHGGVRHMFGLYDVETDRLWGVFARRKSWVEFRTHQQQQESIIRYLTWRNRRRAITHTGWKQYRRGRTVAQRLERLAA